MLEIRRVLRFQNASWKTMSKPVYKYSGLERAGSSKHKTALPLSYEARKPEALRYTLQVAFSIHIS